MKKRTKGIIAGGAAVVVLAGALTALLLTSPDEDEAAEESTSVSSEEKTSALLYDKDPAKISSIDISNESGNIRIERYADNFWTIPDISGFPLDSDLIESAVNSAATLTAETTIKDKTDLSVYGLDSPRITIKTVFDGDTAQEKTVYIGNATPKNNGYYVILEGGTDIYTVKTSALSVFENKEYDYIDHVLYENVTDDDTEDDYDPLKINSLTITRPDLPDEIRIEYDKRKDSEETITGNSSDHVMTSPVSLDLSPDKSNDTLNVIFGLSASDVAAVNPDDAALAEYGLKEPACTVEYDINAGGIKLFIGNECRDEDGNITGYYAMKDGIEAVYVLPTQSVPWIDVMPLDLTMTMITSTYIYSIDTIDIEYEGKSESFALSGDEDTFAVSWNGEEYADTDRFKTFYQYILRAPAEELFLEENSEEPRVSITIKSASGTDKIEFITSGDRMTIIRRNGQNSFRCRTAYVDRLIENIEKLRSGDDIISSW